MSDAGEAAAPALEPEEIARANFYGLVSRFFYGPPDSNFLAEICREPGGQGEDAGELAVSWRRLQESCRSAYPAVLRQEYDSVFVGVGKSEVSPYLSGYAEPTAPDRYLVRLRDQLGAWGLARKERVAEVEDHISGVCDVMRWLVENRCVIADQRRFFEEFAYPGATGFFMAVNKSPSTSFYKQVASLSASFFELEHAAFEMDND